jgi:hypothetical protein
VLLSRLSRSNLAVLRKIRLKPSTSEWPRILQVHLAHTEFRRLATYTTLQIEQFGAFARADRLPELLNQGWYVFYDEDGTYLRWQNHGVNQILVVNCVL